VYLSWVGTDSKGNYLTSGGSRFSNFRKYSAVKVVKAGLKEGEKVGKTIGDTAGDVGDNF
jgi:hypothetical protein